MSEISKLPKFRKRKELIDNESDDKDIEKEQGSNDIKKAKKIKKEQDDSDFEQYRPKRASKAHSYSKEPEFLENMEKFKNLGLQTPHPPERRGRATPKSKTQQRKRATSKPKIKKEAEAYRSRSHSRKPALSKNGFHPRDLPSEFSTRRRDSSTSAYVEVDSEPEDTFPEEAAAEAKKKKIDIDDIEENREIVADLIKANMWLSDDLVDTDQKLMEAEEMNKKLLQEIADLKSMANPLPDTETIGGMPYNRVQGAGSSWNAGLLLSDKPERNLSIDGKKWESYKSLRCLSIEVHNANTLEGVKLDGSTWNKYTNDDGYGLMFEDKEGEIVVMDGMVWFVKEVLVEQKRIESKKVESEEVKSED